MDPRLSISEDLKREFASIAAQCDQLSKDQKPDQIAEIQRRIHELVNKDEFQQNFKELQPVLQKMQKSLSKIEGTWKSSVVSPRGSDLERVSKQISTLFHFLLTPKEKSEVEGFKEKLAESIDTRPVFSERSIDELFVAVARNDFPKIRKLLAHYRIDKDEVIYRLIENGSSRVIALLAETSPKFVSLVRAKDYMFCLHLLRSLVSRPRVQNRQITQLLSDLGLSNPIHILSLGPETLPLPVPAFLPQSMIDLGLDIPATEESSDLKIGLDQGDIDGIRIFLFNGAHVSPETAKRLESDPLFREIWQIRQEAMAKVNREMQRPMVEQLQKTSNVEGIPTDFREQLLMRCYELEEDRHPDVEAKLRMELLSQRASQVIKASDQLAKVPSLANRSQLISILEGLSKDEAFLTAFNIEYGPLSLLESLLGSLRKLEAGEKEDSSALTKINQEIGELFRDMLNIRTPIASPRRGSLRIGKERFERAVILNNHAELRRLLTKHRMSSTEVFFAIENGDLDTFSMILTSFPKLQMRNFVDMVGPAFYLRVIESMQNRPAEQNRQIFKLLADQGLDINQRDPSTGRFPLQAITMEGSFNRNLQELIDQGFLINPEPHLEDSPYLVDCLNLYERTDPLEDYKEGSLETIKTLIFNGARVSPETAKRFAADSSLRKLWNIREEALRRMRQERGAAQSEQMRAGGIVEDLLLLMGAYSDEAATIADSPVVRERFLELCQDIEEEQQKAEIEKYGGVLGSGGGSE